MKLHSPKTCTEWQLDNKVRLYKEGGKEEIDSEDLSKCEGVQFSLFSVCTKSIKVMTLVPTVKEKYQRSQRYRLRRTILRWLSSIQLSSNAHILKTWSSWLREAVEENHCLLQSGRGKPAQSRAWHSAFSENPKCKSLEICKKTQQKTCHN